MEKSVQQTKYLQRLSRQTRHHRLQLNQHYDQQYQQQVIDLTEEYHQNYARCQKQCRLEEHRRDLLQVTVKNIAENKLPPIQPSRTPSSLSSQKSCQLFAKDCSLYPCQPLTSYRSFVKPENDRRLDEPSNDDDSTMKLQDLFSTVKEKKYERDRRQLAITVHNQHHLTNRHVFMQRTKEKLDEESRLLHEQCSHRRYAANLPQRRDPFQQALKRHLQISAKFCTVK